MSHSGNTVMSGASAFLRSDSVDLNGPIAWITTLGVRRAFFQMNDAKLAGEPCNSSRHMPSSRPRALASDNASGRSSRISNSLGFIGHLPHPQLPKFSELPG